MRKLLILFSIFFHCSQPTNDQPFILILWNVGQGQWITIKESTQCLNIDMGGEFKILKKYEAVCGRSGVAVFTHSDQDHISFANQTSIHISKWPRILKSKKSTKMMRLNTSPLPSEFSDLKYFTINDPIQKTLTNGYSTSYAYSDFLIPGDLGTNGERLLLKEIKLQRFKLPKIIVASHHGSRFTLSTEWQLETRMSTYLVSARQARYGHPHTDTLKKWKKNKNAVLKTEDWGNLFFVRYSQPLKY